MSRNDKMNQWNNVKLFYLAIGIVIWLYIVLFYLPSLNEPTVDYIIL